jgi:hypothetical protein
MKEAIAILERELDIYENNRAVKEIEIDELCAATDIYDEKIDTLKNQIHWLNSLSHYKLGGN